MDTARKQLDALVAASFARCTRDELTSRLYEASIAFGALNSVEELDNHAQLRRIEYVGDQNGGHEKTQKDMSGA